MYVPESSRLHIRHLLKAARQPGLFRSFYGKDATCFYLGRGAVWQAIKLLGLKSADKVLVPSYHCGVEIESILQAGAGIEYYKINEDMSADLKSLEDKIGPSCKAVFIIHYYGFAQPIEKVRELSRKHKLFLIEDCAHALLSIPNGAPLGTYGDMAVFSQRKSLPLPDGGALLVNNPRIQSSIRLKKPERSVVLNEILSLLYRPLKDRSARSRLYSAIGKIKRLRPVRTYSKGLDFNSSMGSIGMSETARRIMDGTSIEAVINKRRFNFQHLLEKVTDSKYKKVCFKTLPEGVCPLFFPVRIIEKDRDEAQNLLKKAGIQTFVFGKFPHRSLPEDLFPEAVSLSKEILCLPVHQDMTIKKLDFMANALNSIL